MDILHRKAGAGDAVGKAEARGISGWLFSKLENISCVFSAGNIFLNLLIPFIGVR